jgi:hypothetical protein
VRLFWIADISRETFVQGAYGNDGINLDTMRLRTRRGDGLNRLEAGETRGDSVEERHGAEVRGWKAKSQRCRAAGALSHFPPPS